MTDHPAINYRATVMQLEDIYLQRHGSALHCCASCLSYALNSVVQPMVEIGVSTGRQLQREKICKEIMVEHET